MLGTIVDTHKINITLQRRHKKINNSEVDAHKDTSKHQAVNIQLVEDTLQENKSLRRKRRQGPANNYQKTLNRKTNNSEIDAQNYKQTIGRRHTKRKNFQKQTRTITSKHRRNKVFRDRCTQVTVRKHQVVDTNQEKRTISSKLIQVQVVRKSLTRRWGFIILMREKMFST